MSRLGILVAIAYALAFVPVHAAKPVFRFVGTPTVKESDGQVIVFIGKNAKASSYSKIRITTSDGTAKAGSDYTAVSQTITVANSQLTVVVAIPILNDSISEQTESFTVTMTPVRNATVATPSESVTILDDDAPPPPQWVSAPLAYGGYARIVKSEPSPFTPVGYAPPVGSVWYVVPKGWACTAEAACRVTYDLQPIDQIGVPFTAFAVYREDIEGVAPAPTMALKATAPDSRTAIATKTCMTRLGGASQHEARSGVVTGHSYRISRKWAGKAGMVGALSGSAADGMAVVPESCFGQ